MHSSFFQSRVLRSIALYLLVSAHSSEATPPSPPVPPPFSPLPTASPDVLSTEADGMRALSESGCTDLDGAATDKYGDGCSSYTKFPRPVLLDVCTSAGRYGDDIDFSSSTMCCACGGGALPPSPPLLPPSPPSQPSPPAAPSILSLITCSGGGIPDAVGWSLNCSDGTTLRGGAPYTSSLPLAVALGATCTLDMTDLGRGGEAGIETWGVGWNGAEWAAPGFGQSFSLASGLKLGTESFVVQFQPPPPPSSPPPPPSPPSPPSPPLPPPSPPPSPPSPPLQPGSSYAVSSSALIAALNDGEVSRIVLVAGTYEFDDIMCSDEGGSALCIDRRVTIEAEVAGSVVLDAGGARRVIYVSSGGRAELIGLNITGGYANSGGGGLFIDSGGEANLDGCNVYTNTAEDVRLFSEQLLHRPFGTLLALMVGSWVGDSTFLAQQR